MMKIDDAYIKLLVLYRNLDFSKDAGKPSFWLQQGCPRPIWPGCVLREGWPSAVSGNNLVHIYFHLLTFRVFRWRFTSSLPGSLADSSTIPLLTGGLCPGRVNNGLSLEIYLLFHHQGLLALEPQVLSPQALRDHSLRSDVRRFLRSLLHHELRRHLWAQEPQIPLVDDTGSPSVQFSS